MKNTTVVNKNATDRRGKKTKKSELYAYLTNLTHGVYQFWILALRYVRFPDKGKFHIIYMTKQIQFGHWINIKLSLHWYGIKKFKSMIGASLNVIALCHILQCTQANRLIAIVNPSGDFAYRCHTPHSICFSASLLNQPSSLVMHTEAAEIHIKVILNGFLHYPQCS